MLGTWCHRAQHYLGEKTSVLGIKHSGYFVYQYTCRNISGRCVYCIQMLRVSAVHTYVLRVLAAYSQYFEVQCCEHFPDWQHFGVRCCWLWVLSVLQVVKGFCVAVGAANYWQSTVRRFCCSCCEHWQYRYARGYTLAVGSNFVRWEHLCNHAYGPYYRVPGVVLVSYIAGSNTKVDLCVFFTFHIEPFFLPIDVQQT